MPMLSNKEMVFSNVDNATIISSTLPAGKGTDVGLGNSLSAQSFGAGEDAGHSR